jgi:hypothetical protein
MIPLIPLPKKTPPMYLKGSTPAIPYVLLYTIPPKNPKTRSRVISAAQAGLGSKAFVSIGKIIMTTALAANPKATLTL